MDLYYKTYRKFLELMGYLSELGRLYRNAPKGLIQGMRYPSLVLEDIEAEAINMGELKGSIYVRDIKRRFSSKIKGHLNKVRNYLESMEVCFDSLVRTALYTSEILDLLVSSPDRKKLGQKLYSVNWVIDEAEPDLEMRRKLVDDLDKSAIRFPLPAVYEEFWLWDKGISATCVMLSSQFERFLKKWVKGGELQDRIIEVQGYTKIEPSPNVYALLLKPEKYKLGPLHEDLEPLDYEWLSEFENLEHLEITSRIIDSPDTPNLIPSLRTVIFDNCYIYDESPLLDAPQLECVTFKECRFDSELPNLLVAPSLEQIEFKDCELESCDVNFLSDSKLLRRLSIREKLSSIDLNPLKNCRYISEIDLRQPKPRYSQRNFSVNITEIIDLPELRILRVEKGTKLVIALENYDEGSDLASRRRWSGSEDAEFEWKLD